MKYYAKSREKKLSQEEMASLKNTIQRILDELEEQITEKEKQIILRELECLERSEYKNIPPQKTLEEHHEEIVTCAERFFEQYGSYFSDLEKRMVIEACRIHDLGKVNTLFQIRVNEELKQKVPRCLWEMKQIPHGFLSAISVSGKELKEKFQVSAIQEVYPFITAVHYHHAREDEWEGKEFKEIAREFYEPRLRDYLGKEEEVKLYYSNRSKLLFQNNSSATNLIENKDQWNRYILIKGLLNKFDYTVSAGYEESELAPDLEKKELKRNIERAFQGVELRPAQKYMKENSDKNLVIIAPTGSGKTEGALLWLNGEKGFYTLPLKVSSNAIYERIKEKYSFQEVSLVHSDSMEKYLEEYEIYNKSPYEKYESAKRLAYPLTVCTIDQLFRFVYKALGTEIFAATLKYSKLILDEIQSYEPRVIATIIYGLKTVNELGGKFAIITATFPPVLKYFMERYGLLEGEQFQFQDFSKDSAKIRHKVDVRDGEIDTSEILSLGGTKKVLVICNTVKRAQEIYQKLNEETEQVYLLHSKYIRRDRDKLERMIMKFSESQDQRGIWITTQIVEASLDIDFDILYTEMSTADSLLQRMGRCNRKGRFFPASANIIIYENENGVGKNGRAIYEKEIYDRSLEKLYKYINIPFSEKMKIEYINEVYSTEEIKETNYFKQIKKYLEHFGVIRPLEYENKEAEKKFRNIQNVTIVPEPIYLQNKTIFDKCIEILQTPHVSKEIKNLFRFKINSLTLSRSCYGNKMPAGVDVQSIGETERKRGTEIHRARYKYEFDYGTAKGRGLVEDDIEEDPFW